MFRLLNCGKFLRVKKHEKHVKSDKKASPKSNGLYWKKQKISIKYVTFGNKTYIIKMEDNKCKTKIDDICKNFIKVSHNKQAELSAKITDQI